MRRTESNCMDCGCPSGYCYGCMAEIIECDMCGNEIDGKAYALPEDGSDEDYCSICFTNRLMDEATTATEFTECPNCDSEGVEVFQYRGEYFCNDCVDNILEIYEKEG